MAPWELDNNLQGQINEFDTTLNVLKRRLSKSSNPSQDNQLLTMYQLLDLRFANLNTYASQKQWYLQWKQTSTIWLKQQRQALIELRVKLKISQSASEATRTQSPQNIEQLIQQLKQKLKGPLRNKPIDRVKACLEFSSQYHDKLTASQIFDLGLLSLEQIQNCDNALVNCCQTGNLVELKKFVDFLEGLSLQNYLTRGFIAAAEAGQLEIMKWLLTYEYVAIDCRDLRPTSAGWTVAHWAARNNQVETFTYLWKNYPNLLDARTGCGLLNGDETILHVAIQNKAIDIIVAILEAEPQPLINQIDQNGWTPLHWAVRKEYTNIVKLLLKCGADLDIENKEKQTALAMAKYQASDGILFSGSPVAKKIVEMIVQEIEARNSINFISWISSKCNIL